jgi:uncharacterized membrane protein
VVILAGAFLLPCGFTMPAMAFINTFSPEVFVVLAFISGDWNIL